MKAAASRPKNIRALNALIREHGLGQTLPKLGKRRYPPLPSGTAEFDERLGGGFPRGVISEVTGPCSSGRTGLLLAALAQSTQAHEIAAYVDATDSLDQRSAQRAGVVLDRLLWIRCGQAAGLSGDLGQSGLACMDAAWRAANLVVSAGGFGLVAVDLAGLPKRALGDWQRRPWLRFKHALEGSSTALVVLAEAPLAGSAAGMVLELQRGHTQWQGVLGAASIRLDVVRDRTHATGVRA